MTSMKQFVSVAIMAMETGKTHFFIYHSNGCYEEKYFIKNESYRYILPLVNSDDWISNISNR